MTSNPEASPAPPSENPKAKLSKEERRELLAQIEHRSSRTESAERTLQRAEQALNDGNHAQAERLVAHLEKRDPHLLGLDNLKSRLAEALRRSKMAANVQKAEEMLVRYIEERKKTAAEFALEALGELAPEHPRLDEYRIWVRDLDKEAAAQKRLEEELAAGRVALQVGELEVARRHLETMRKLEPESGDTLRLEVEISQAEAGEAESADIAGIKRRFDEHLAGLRLTEAEAELANLAHHAVPKITLDRFKLRLDEAREAERDLKELQTFEELFCQHLEMHRWQQARDVAHKAGQRFPQSPRPSEMFSEVNLKEADERHQESIRQGIATLEQFLSQGNRDSAQLALKLLKGKIDDRRFAELKARVEAL